MKKTRKSSEPISADAIAGLADRGKDITRYFKGEGRMVQPIQRVNVDLTAGMLEELDRAAQELNVSRQAVIKTLVRQALDRHYLAQRAKRALSAMRSAGSLGTHGRAIWSRDDLHER
jgi:Ribbon-helix-helix protein, copG family